MRESDLGDTDTPTDRETSMEQEQRLDDLSQGLRASQAEARAGLAETRAAVAELRASLAEARVDITRRLDSLSAAVAALIAEIRDQRDDEHPRC